jgi:Fur family transcriptional regulator, stress-responsive regulator
MTSAPPTLKRAGLRVTAGRVDVLAAVEEFPHSTADALWHLLRPSRPSLSVQSVHNILGDLTAAGLLRRIEPAGSAALYERRIGDNHHHVVCSGCGVVADIDCIHGEAPCLTPGDSAGFTIHTAEITFWGLCETCAALTPQSQSTHQ